MLTPEENEWISSCTRDTPIPEEWILVYGASDDLVEIEGAMRGEFYALANDEGTLTFSDGTVLHIAYDGTWNITVVEAGPAFELVVRCLGDPDADVYSDMAWLRPVDSVTFSA